MMLEELQERVRAANRLQIRGMGNHSRYLPESDAPRLSMSELSGVIQFDDEDQVVEVWSGTTIADLQDELRKKNQCLPIGVNPCLVDREAGTVGGLLAMNLPHGLVDQCGGPRDWTLGLTVIRSDGFVAKCGSKAVKSVAGYDVQKLFVGSRGTLGVIAKLILKTYPLKALPSSSLVTVSSAQNSPFISRHLSAVFESEVKKAEGLVAYDPASCTLWTQAAPPCPEEGWVIGPKGYRKSSSGSNKFEIRAREVFDSRGVFARGWTE